MGLIGLADPVFAMRARDTWVGWTAERRRTALTNMMDAFVLGAVPPYNDLRAGKLMALLAASTEVKDAFAQRYANRTSLISQRDPDAVLAAVTTTSALGRSSVYNRLRRPDGTLAMLPIGYTAGSGDFHLSGSIYDELVGFARARGLEHRTQRHERWSDASSGSPRSRRAVLDLALTELGFNSKLLRVHGVQREMFLSPLMHNTAEFLRGDTATPEWRDLSAQDLSAWWRDRWVKPRASRDDLWRDFFPWQWRLWHETDDDVDAR